MKEKVSEWFSEWFNSPYYHILYKHRDEEEAKNFIDLIAQFLQFSNGMKALDLGCGRGRHAVYLCKKGLQVTGVDIAPQNISYANKFASEKLSFYVHDMREPLPDNDFDFVLNLFTSFGYFETEEEDLRVLNAASHSLKKGGILLIDFMNVEKIIKKLVTQQIITVEGIEFNITRSFKDGFVIKEINFVVEGKPYQYFEKVKAITRDLFLKYFESTGFEVKNIFGNYFLEEFNEDSERMIFVAEKS